MQFMTVKLTLSKYFELHTSYPNHSVERHKIEKNSLPWKHYNANRGIKRFWASLSCYFYYWKKGCLIFNQYHFFYWKQYLYQKLSFSIAVWSQEIVYRCSLNFERYRIIETCISIHRSYFCNNLSFCWE